MKASVSMTIKDVAFLAKNLGNLYADRKADIKNERINTLFADLEAKRVHLADTTGKATDSASLDKADSACDSEIRLLFTYAEGLCASPFADEAAAAEAVYAVLQQFGRAITGERYAVQYSKTDDMLKRLSEPKIAEAVKALRGMTERIERVREAAEAFSRLSKTTVQTSAANSEKSAYVIKREILSLVNNEILPYLNAICVVEGDTYKPFLAEIEKEITRANAAIKSAKQPQQPQAVSPKADTPQA
ncbi:MAG: hypothetical protein II811_04150 [Spirochaetaceae bacterium]|nr:hypothetical protein [Spirochaetaceae bacterium]